MLWAGKERKCCFFTLPWSSSLQHVKVHERINTNMLANSFLPSSRPSQFQKTTHVHCFLIIKLDYNLGTTLTFPLFQHAVRWESAAATYISWVPSKSKRRRQQRGTSCDEGPCVCRSQALRGNTEQRFCQFPCRGPFAHTAPGHVHAATSEERKIVTTEVSWWQKHRDQCGLVAMQLSSCLFHEGKDNRTFGGGGGNHFNAFFWRGKCLHQLWKDVG